MAEMTEAEAEDFRQEWQAHRADLLRRLSREVAPSVPFAPTTFAGFDRAACRCGPASELEPGGDGLLTCRVCSKVALGAAQLAWTHGCATWHEECEDWHGLRQCHLCDQPSALTSHNADEIICISCGERIDRQVLRARRAESDRRADEAAARLATTLWRHRLRDMAQPSQSPKYAGRFAEAIDRAAAILAEAAVQPKGPGR